MTNKINVLILGYGEMGHAIEFLLQNHAQLTVWERHPKDGTKPILLDKVITNQDIVFFCLPVNAHQSIAQIIKPNLNTNCICISIAKGLNQQGLTAQQIFANTFNDNQKQAFMYGPMISEEIQTGKVAFAELGCSDNKIFTDIDSLFKNTALYLQRSTDIIGISWSVILKNVYALLFGLADELRLGDNMRGYLAQATLNELNKVVLEMKGRDGTPYSLAGLGDLVTTATSQDSHHHALGCMLARGETNNISGEGIHTLEMVIKYRLFDINQYPIFNLIHHIVKNPSCAKISMNTLIELSFSD